MRTPVHAVKLNKRGNRLLPLAAAVAALAVPTSELLAQALEEVVVTAQFREERLQTTPIAISALTGDQLEAMSLTNVTQVSASAPNVTLRQGSASFGKTLQTSIRGIGHYDNQLSIEPGVAIYIDDVYHGLVYGSTFDLLDLERIEILRGPQGTLFGKNAIGGAIRLISKAPQGDDSGYIAATTGSFDRLDINAGFDIALVPEKLFMRASFLSKERDGYVDVLDFACVNPGMAGNLQPVKPARRAGGCKIGELGDENLQAGRVAFRWLPNDDLDITVTGDYSKDDSAAPAQKLIWIDSTSVPAQNWNQNVAIPTFGVPYDDRFIIDNHYKTYANGVNDLPGGFDTILTSVFENWGLNATVKWRLNEKLELTSITGYRESKGGYGVDQDGSPLPVKATSAHFNHEQFTQELRLSGSALNERLDWTVGAYYLESDSLGRDANDFTTSNLSFITYDPASLENRSVFAHGVYRFTDRLSVTAGLRYTEEDKDYQFFRQRTNGQMMFPVTPVDVSYDEITPRLSVEYQFNDDLMVYASYTEGFRSGGFNPRPTTERHVTGFGPETVQSYEIGTKSEWFERRLRANAAIFYSEYDDLQMNAAGEDPLNPGFPIFTWQNVGKAVIQGVELELLASPIDNLTLNASVGWLDYENKDLGAAEGAAGGPTLDSWPMHTPEWKGAVGIQYEFNLGDMGTLTMRGDARYQSKIYNDAANNEAIAIDPYTIVDARITWASLDDKWTVSLFGTNLTDREYFVAKFRGNTPPPTHEGTPGRPREWGLSIKRNFF
ncbi:MAG: TonB-dependent receptor [Spongiibacteraceae bacterium]|nr:TonB-dependent receptor [Spongiibacteraceae bacterium]